MKTGQRLCNTSRCISAKSMSPIALFGYFRGKQTPSIPPLLLPFLPNLCFSKVNKTTNIWYVSRSWAQKTQTKNLFRGSLLFQDTHIICKHLFYAQRPCLSPAVLEERVLHARVLRRKLSLAMDKNGALGTPFKTQSSGLGKQTQQGIPSKIEWDLTNGPLSKLLELLHTQVFSGSVKHGSCGSDFLEMNIL